MLQARALSFCFLVLSALFLVHPGHGQKDKKKEVGIIFLEKTETQSSSATFIKAQRELLSQGYPNPGLLEVGEYDGRNYMSMSLEE